MTDEKAMSIAAVFRCIRILSETCSGLPLRAYSGTQTGDRKLLPDSHWLPTLLREPNETMTGDELVEAWVGQMAGWGNAYSQIVPNANGRPVELWPYKVDNMLVTFAFKSERLKEIADLVTCITRNVEKMQTTAGFHPKWKDVDVLDIDRIKWPAHPAAVAAIHREIKKAK